MKIGILQCGHAIEPVQREHGDFSAMLQRLLAGHGFNFATWNVVDMDFPEDHRAADAWALTGSKHGVYEDHAFIAPLEDLVRAAHQDSVPMVGICFGHQLIAQALGGRVEKYAGGWSIGRQVYDFDGHGSLSLNAWHQDQVITPPEGAQTIARSDFCAHAALRIGETVLTIQPHPEFTNSVMADYVRLRRGPPFPDDLMQAALDRSHIPNEAGVVATDIANFLKKHRPT